MRARPLAEAGLERLPRRRRGAPGRCQRRGAILLPAGRLRSVAMLLALALFPALILGDQWHSHQIVDLRDDTVAPDRPRRLAVAVSAALAYVFSRWPVLLPLAIVAALPFRVPLHAGGDTANLLVPLYLVIAGGVLAARAGVASRGAARGCSAPRGGGPLRRQDPPGSPPWLPRILAAVVLLLRCRSCTPRTSRRACRTSASSSCRSVGLWVAARRRPGTEGSWLSCSGSLRSRQSRSSRRLGGVGEPQLVLERPGDPVERIPHLLQGQFGVLGPQRLRAVSGAGRCRRDERAALGARTADAGLADCLVAVLWIGLVPTFSQSSFAALLRVWPFWPPCGGA